MLPGGYIVSFEEAANAEFRAGHADDDDAIGDQRRTRHGIAVLDRCRLRRLDLPDHLAGLGVHRDDLVVQKQPDDHPVVDRDAAIHDAAAHDAQRLRRIVVRGAPELLAGQRIDGRRHVVGGGVDHAVLDDRECLRAAAVVDRVRPLRHAVRTGQYAATDRRRARSGSETNFSATGARHGAAERRRRTPAHDAGRIRPLRAIRAGQMGCGGQGGRHTN